MLKKVNISALAPNPFRELDDYPIDREKVDALKESIEATGFWGTVVVRKVGSKYQLAFGHHRWVALKELKQKTCEVIVRDLSNEDMVQMMARENLEEWGTNAYIEAQTVESTIRAYGAGEIEIPAIPGKSNDKHIQYAAKSTLQHPYTKMSIAQFLGWTTVNEKTGRVQPNHACNTAFDMVDAFESGIVTRKQLRGVKREIARQIVSSATAVKREQERVAKDREREAKVAEEFAEQETDARKKRAYKSAAARKRAEAETAEKSAKKVAKEFAKDAIKQTKSGKWSRDDVRAEAAEEKARLRSKVEQRYKNASQHLSGLRRDLCKVISKHDDHFTSLKKLLSMDCGLTSEDIDDLQAEVDALAERAAKFSVELGKWVPLKTNSVESQLRIVG